LSCRTPWTPCSGTTGAVSQSKCNVAFCTKTASCCHGLRYNVQNLRRASSNLQDQLATVGPTGIRHRDVSHLSRQTGMELC
jgi:hypothetical protein